MDRIAVAGGGGFIGSNLVKFLKDKGHYVKVVDINLPEFRRGLWGLADDYGKADLRKPDVAKWLCQDVDTVYQLAADMGGRGYITDTNTQAAENSRLINRNILAAIGDKNLFFSSSACAYPGGIGPAEDKFGQRPADGPYGEEKLDSALKYLEAGKRVGILHTVYGPYQEYEGERMKFPTAITRKVIEGAKRSTHPNIEIWGDGTQTRTFCYIQDALEKIYRVMEAEEYAGPVNIGSDEEVTIKEIADDLCEYAGIVPHYIFKPDAPTGPVNRGCDNTLFNETYGKVPQTSARVGFQKLYDWQKSQTT